MADEDNDKSYEYDEGDEDNEDNDELEEDKGDAEDIVDERETIGEQEAHWRQEEEDARIDRYEILCDAAALRGIDVEDSRELEILAQSIGLISEQVKDLGSSKCKGRGATKRGATKGLRTSEPMFLEFDDLGRPRGKWRLKFGQHVGFCMRKFNICWN